MAGFWAALPVTMGVRALFDRYRSRALTGLRVQGRISRLKELNAFLRQADARTTDTRSDIQGEIVTDAAVVVE